MKVSRWTRWARFCMSDLGDFCSFDGVATDVAESPRSCFCVLACRLCSCKLHCCHEPDETLPPARPEYIFPHLCPQCALSESPSLYTVMNRGISGSKVFHQSPDENLSETLDFFTYLAPQRSRVGEGGLCEDKQKQDAAAMDKVLPEASHRLTRLWP